MYVISFLIVVNCRFFITLSYFFYFLYSFLLSLIFFFVFSFLISYLFYVEVNWVKKNAPRLVWNVGRGLLWLFFRRNISRLGYSSC